MIDSERVVVVAALALACWGCTQSKDAAVNSSASTSAAATVTALAEAPDQSFSRGDVAINYRVIGAGEPVLLVHGYGDNLMMWSGFLADSLARDYRVVAIDTRAFGKSGKPAGAEHYGGAMVDDLVALLDHERIAQAHVVGYSMGAILTAELALTHPGRVRTATMVAGIFPKDSVAMHALGAPWIADIASGRRLTRFVQYIVPLLPDSVARGYSDQLFAESDSAALLGVLEGLPRLSVDWAKVTASQVPVVVAVGIDDPLRPYSAALAANWPEAKHVELPATNHITVFTSPVLLAEVRGLLSANPIR